MIRRNDGNDWLLIAQADHARLAADIARVWGNDDVPSLPLPDQLVAAIRDHDDGWREWEQSPEIDPATGGPRDFTEMPMSAATRIWSKSIFSSACGDPSHADALHRCRQFFDSRQLRFTLERAMVLDTVLSFRHGFQIEELLDELPQVTRPTVYRTVKLLHDAGVIRRGVDGAMEPAVARVGSSRLGGLWVSRHFCWLAEKARESRDDVPDDLAAIERFLSEQAELQQKWTDQGVREFAGEELPRLIETGYRYLQFFDRISLWLCCTENPHPIEMALPGIEPIRLIPQAGETIVVEPFALRVESLELSVDASRVPAHRYDQDHLQQVIAAAPSERLSWSLRR
jgi:hypothetical protein